MHITSTGPSTSSWNSSTPIGALGSGMFRASTRRSTPVHERQAMTIATRWRAQHHLMGPSLNRTLLRAVAPTSLVQRATSHHHHHVHRYQIAPANRQRINVGQLNTTVFNVVAPQLLTRTQPRTAINGPAPLRVEHRAGRTGPGAVTAIGTRTPTLMRHSRRTERNHLRIERQIRETSTPPTARVVHDAPPPSTRNIYRPAPSGAKLRPMSPAQPGLDGTAAVGASRPLPNNAVMGTGRPAVSEQPPAAVDVEELTRRVMAAIDRRLVANRERMGRR